MIYLKQIAIKLKESKVLMTTENCKLMRQFAEINNSKIAL